MRILITTGIFPPEIGGPSSYASVLGDRLKDKAEVTVVTYSAVFSHEGDKKLSFKVVRVWKGWPKFLRHAIYFFKVFIHSSKADVIYSLNAVSAGLPALFTARLRKKKFFVKIVGDYAWEMAVQKQKSSLLINDFQQAPKKGWIKILADNQRKVCLKADGVIVPSKFLAGIVEGWGIDSKKIKVIYNGVDFKKSDLSREDARKKIGIMGNIIVTSGRLVPWKGFRMLIKMMPKIFDISQSLRLIIIGDGPDKKNLETIIKNMGLERKVYLVGKKTKEEMAVYFAAADMFILNSGYEGFSHQILEAMTAEMPIIASAVGGNKEVIVQGKNGFLVKYNDEFNLAEAIKGLWQDPSLREQFTKEGLKTVKDFSVDRMLEETIKILIP